MEGIDSRLCLPVRSREGRVAIAIQLKRWIEQRFSEIRYLSESSLAMERSYRNGERFL